MSLLITGSRKGLGRDLARRFRQIGQQVVQHTRESVSSEELGADDGFIFCDLLKLDELEIEMDRIKKKKILVSHLICNAGKSTYNTSGLDCLQNIASSINDNLIVTSNAVYAALKIFNESLKTVTVIGSICGEESVNGAPLEYSVSKSSLKAFTKLCSQKFSHMDVRFNLVTPGNLMFEGSVWESKRLHDELMFQTYLSENSPSGMIGNPDDVFNLIRFLISDDAKYVNGANMVIDGGQVRKW